MRSDPVRFDALLAAKRAGLGLASAELGAISAGLADGGLDDAQAGALAMAICLRGLSPRETVDLTAAMRDSGRVLHWPSLGVEAPVLDKHSTGGVGDCLSLVLAPVLAACGAAVPMVSGRGLGHTGGTLDKLEALPGLSTEMDLDRFADCVRRHGLAIVSASNELAPADQRLYAIRDRTATVDSLPLIVSSILSKKLAAGVQHLLLDLKLGSGAIFRERGEGEALARLLAATAAALGLGCELAFTDMDQPLANAAGNALELVLRGEDTRSRLYRLNLSLCARLLLQGGLCVDLAQAQVRVHWALCSGAAAQRFEAMVRAMGGPADALSAPQRWREQAPCIGELCAADDGILAGIDTRLLGEACLQLGTGRGRADARIDPRVGLSDILEVGVRVRRGEPLLRIHAHSIDALQAARAQLSPALQISDRVPEPRPLLQGWLGGLPSSLPASVSCAAQNACVDCGEPGCGGPRALLAARTQRQCRAEGLCT
jgi:thymidine phosphorylase